MILVIVILLMVCLEPMGWAPLWNGEVPGHRNQYEKMGDAILKGQLHLDIPVEEGLLALENPYDPAARSGLYYQWDHAYYNGHYYMYFGVVPALLVFAPYQWLTGQMLTTFRGTQVFAGLFRKAPKAVGESIPKAALAEEIAEEVPAEAEDATDPE